jgi:hypothetical protein
MGKPNAHWRIPFMHCIRRALALADANAGSNIAARMAIMAITTSSSINVNPEVRHRLGAEFKG